MNIDPTEAVGTVPSIEPKPEKALPPSRAVRQTRAMGFPDRALDVVQRRGFAASESWDRLTAAVRRGAVSLLWGSRGTGKTVEVTCLGLCWHRRGYMAHGPARYWRLGDLLTEQKAWFGRDKDDADKRWHPEPMAVAAECGLLVLDELDETGETGYDVPALVRLVDTRYAAFRPTVIVSNREPRAIKEHFGLSILDRVREGGEFVPMVGESRRGGASC